MNPMQIPDKWQGNYQQPGTENPKPNSELGVFPHNERTGNPLDIHHEQDDQKHSDAVLTAWGIEFVRRTSGK